MKLLVSRFVLGCISAVLVLADVASEKSIESSPTLNISVVDAVTEKIITPLPDLTQKIKHSETTLSPDKNTKLFSNPSGGVKGNIKSEIVVIHDQAGGGGGHHDHGYHDHHAYHDRHDPHHEHDYHHPPPARPPPHHQHDHHHPPPHHHHYPPPYPGYYPPHYPPYSHGMPQPYAAVPGVPPPYPYYPPPTYYNAPPMKPSATIIQTSSNTGQNFPKPTDLLNQGTDYLWNLFGKLGAVTSENHEVVLINPKPAPPTVTSVQMPTWYPNRGKIVPNIDCSNKNE